MKITINADASLTVTNRHCGEAATITKHTTAAQIDDLSYRLHLTTTETGKLVQIAASSDPSRRSNELNIQFRTAAKS